VVLSLSGCCVDNERKLDFYCGGGATVITIEYIEMTVRCCTEPSTVGSAQGEEIE
jgi:hypothetical protein